uniref:Unextended protein n=1 Tax=Drosophila melanogaster TaxID=7227 RepID=UEX_DROME|nr:unextended, isoform F [Drosophila melanogaster]NP_001104391.2 unextended, isoform E [Drosophila melanogaster]NP_001263162.1 unextended, isoform G [Drosophila melanogaster]NP_001288144.1 unextended, isoform H [Drosophila melanogaster]A0A0B7P9G0.1 RecName: Full=Unextended protein; AltName: Full=Putative metal transporter uex; Flags: Precursor [Drosophila melanogaster]AIG63332.1 unextended, isoform H [Drosophila melanogaster]EDP28148.2 unextended, isoform F [Drosophila melanogaster]EDP28149.|eukprot:NP_001104390.2 unextended, isoform F [Drosophila melanogaster]
MNTYFISFITIIIFANGINGTSVDTSNKLLLQKANDFNLSQNLSSSRTRRTIANSFRIVGIRLEDETVETKNGIPTVLVDKEQQFRVFGSGLEENTAITFTNEKNDYGGPCLKPATDLFTPIEVSSNGFSALYSVKFPSFINEFFICAKTAEKTTNHSKAATTTPLEHQGNSDFLKIKTFEPLIPVWLAIIIIVTCLGFSALFSGLNLGLMSMDRTELKILRNTGTEKEKKYASKIAPVRDQGNYLLCSILLGNVLVNSTFTILLDGLTSGLFAVIFSTLAIVLFGEITPQAVCSRHGLAIGAKTILVTKTVMAITAPLSYPVSRILDKLLGEEIGNVYNRERLKELVRVTNDVNDLDKNEVNIISGALELRKKTVADVMTHINDAFMLSLDALLDFETVSEIMNSGYSRIPVYDGDRKNIVTLLYIKDLAFVDTDDNTPLKTLCEFYQNPVHFVFEDYTLDIMFNQFKEGTIGHIAFVHRVNNEGDGDPFYETVGLVTLEDVIEELIQAEIVDETDVFVDNRTKTRRNRYKKADFSAFAERREVQTVRISPQLTLATFQYLSTAVDAFKKDVISELILRRLLNQDVFHNIKTKGKSKDDPSLYIFTQGKAVDFFVLILEGRVEVTIGKEALMFESGPFTYFGTQALVPNVVIDSPTQMGSLQSLNMDSKIRQSFVPDYSVRAISDVIYITIKRVLYLTAKKATLLEKSRKSGTFSSETFDDEVERLLHSITENEKPSCFAQNQSTRRLSNRSINSSPTNMNRSPDFVYNSVDEAIQDDTKLKNIKHADNVTTSISLVAAELEDLHSGEQDTTAASMPLLPKLDDKFESKQSKP